MQIPILTSHESTNTPDILGLKTALEAARIKNGVPGMSIAIMYKGKVVFAEGFGKRNSHQPFTKETVSPICSLTKAFTATAIGEMVSEGKMDWDTTPVNKYLPEFVLQDPVLTSQLTLADLLSHRTRLPSTMFFPWLRTRESRLDLIKRLRYATMPSKLTSQMNYSNPMYAVAGEAAAAVAGVPYENVVQDKILGPLGLLNTGFSQSAMKKLPNHASPYYAFSLEDAQAGKFIEGEYDEIYMAFAPAGDLYSNVLDLVRWGEVVLNGGVVKGKQVLNEKNIRMTLTPQTIEKQEGRMPDFGIVANYGLGWRLDTYKGHCFFSHTGLYPGARAHLAIFPDDHLIIAQLANIHSTQLLTFSNFYIADRWLDLAMTRDWLMDVAVEQTSKEYLFAADQKRGKFPPQIKNRPSVLPENELTGKFESLLYGVVTVKWRPLQEQDEEDEKDRKKILEFRWNSFKSQLSHYHYESFKVVLRDLSFAMAMMITYEMGDDGHVSGLTLDLGESRPVRFTKNTLI